MYIYVYICAWCRQRRCRGVHTQHTPANISIYIPIYIRYIHCTQACFLPYTDICIYIYIHTYIYIYIYIYIYEYVYTYICVCISSSSKYEYILIYFFLVFSPLKPLPRSLTRLEGSIPHTHTHISICTFLLVVYDSNSRFGGRLRHRLVAPVFHGSATPTRPMLQPYLNVSQYISIHICR
jgi:hypothetical protein